MAWFHLLFVPGQLLNADRLTVFGSAVTRDRSGVVRGMLIDTASTDVVQHGQLGGTGLGLLCAFRCHRLFPVQVACRILLECNPVRRPGWCEVLTWALWPSTTLEGLKMRFSAGERFRCQSSNLPPYRTPSPTPLKHAAALGWYRRECRL